MKMGRAGNSSRGTGFWMVAMGLIAGLMMVRLPPAGGLSCNMLMLSNWAEV